MRTKLSAYYLTLTTTLAIVTIAGCESTSSSALMHPTATILNSSSHSSSIAANVNSSTHAGLRGIYVVDTPDNSIYILPTTANGSSVTPKAVLGGPLTGLNQPAGVAVDGKGNIYVTNQGDDTIEMFKSGSIGDIPPVRTIQVFTPSHQNRPIAIGLVVRDDILYVSMYDDVWIYWIGESGNVMPFDSICTFIDSQCSGFIAGQNVAVDSAGLIYLTNQVQCAFVYTSVSSGSLTQLGCLSVGSTQPNYVSVDDSNNVYVSTQTSSPASISVFGPFSRGGSPMVGISDYGPVAVETPGAVFVSNAKLNAIDVWQRTGSTWTMIRQVTGLAEGFPWHAGFIALN